MLKLPPRALWCSEVITDEVNDAKGTLRGFSVHILLT
jgi:hypothetical protein